MREEEAELPEETGSPFHGQLLTCFPRSERRNKNVHEEEQPALRTPRDERKRLPLQTHDQEQHADKQHEVREGDGHEVLRQPPQRREQGERHRQTRDQRRLLGNVDGLELVHPEQGVQADEEDGHVKEADFLEHGKSSLLYRDIAVIFILYTKCINSQYICPVKENAIKMRAPEDHEWSPKVPG